MSDKNAAFESHAARLRGLAYRLTGSLSDADDLLQEARIRWLAVDQPVTDAGAYLKKMVTRLGLDWLKSARVRRETYVGPWLPEPVFDAATLDADAAGELAADISMALMMTLERLSPLERAAFLLHDVFDFDYDEVADTLGRQEAAVRKLAERARQRVRQERPRFHPTDEETQRVLGAFFVAAQRGDVDALRQVLADDVVFYSDGGGKVSAALLPIRGPDKVARFIIGIQRKFYSDQMQSFLPAQVNGMPGFVRREGETVQQVGAFQVVDGRVRAIFSVLNPEKLRHLS